MSRRDEYELLLEQAREHPGGFPAKMVRWHGAHIVTDYREAWNAYYTLRGIDLRQKAYRQHPELRQAVRDARAAALRSAESMTKLIWGPLR